MYICSNCNKPTLNILNIVGEGYSKVCENCNTKEKIIIKKAKCFRCGKEYDKISDFIPSGCEYCRVSFVD